MYVAEPPRRSGADEQVGEMRVGFQVQILQGCVEGEYLGFYFKGISWQI